MRTLIAMLIVSALVLVAVVALSQFGGKDAPVVNADYLDKLEGTPTPKPTPYRKPVLGMDFSDFNKLCGLQTRSTWSETAAGRRTVYYYSDSDARYAKGCVGYFVFDDYTLVSIYRD